MAEVEESRILGRFFRDRERSYNRTLIDGTAISGRKLISGRFSLLSDSFHRKPGSFSTTDGSSTSWSKTSASASLGNVYRDHSVSGDLRGSFPSRISEFLKSDFGDVEGLQAPGRRLYTLIVSRDWASIASILTTSRVRSCKFETNEIIKWAA
jgi:hypothetical protein